MQATNQKVRASPETLEHHIRSLQRRSIVLATLAGLLLLAVVVVGAVWFFGRDAAIAPGIDADVVEEIETLIEDYRAAWDSGDGAAVVALMATDGVHISEGTEGLPIGGAELEAYADRLGFLTWETVGPTTIESHGLDYVVTATTKIYPDTGDGENLRPTIGLFRVGPQVGESGLFIEYQIQMTALEFGS